MKMIYEVQIRYGEKVLIFTSRDKAYKFSALLESNSYVYTISVNIFTYYFYKLIGR